MKIFTLSHKNKKKFSPNNKVVYSYEYIYENKKIYVPAKNKLELLFRKHFLDDK